MVASERTVFTTEQVTTLLGLNVKKDKWRVVRFAQSREYGITPSISEASGPGSRRLYDIENVCQIALALRLLETGLRPRVIGEIIRKLRRTIKLSPKLMAEGFGKSLYLVISRQPRVGRLLNEERFQLLNFVEDIPEVQELFDEIEDEFQKRPDCDLLFVSLGRMFQEINRNLRRMAKGGGD
jgi:DNA-binding transcriptional MerR regulator